MPLSLPLREDGCERHRRRAVERQHAALEVLNDHRVDCSEKRIPPPAFWQNGYPAAKFGLAEAARLQPRPGRARRRWPRGTVVASLLAGSKLSIHGQTGQGADDRYHQARLVGARNLHEVHLARSARGRLARDA